MRNYFCIPEEKFIALAEELRPLMEHTIDEPFTPVTLEKIQASGGPVGEQLDSYQELFEDVETQKKPNKVLLVSDPGLGKTAVAKKCYDDWAKNLLTAFSLVLFVSLKLVRPGESIENIIIQQTPAFDALNVTQWRLKKILESFANRTLMILDGLDQHSLGSNEDVFGIITGNKLQNCNILLTSRPHSIGDLKQLFPTVAKINGFTKSQTMEFANSILQENSQVEQIMNLTPNPVVTSDNMYYNPELLHFFCSFVRDRQKYPSGTKPDLGEICTRIIRMLYFKFIGRKCVDYRPREFISMLNKVGHLAWQTNLIFHRSNITRIIGGEAFNYGLFTGLEDNETGEIHVTFLNDTIQAYLAAFSFIQTFSNSENVLRYDHGRIFMKNPTFLYFCLWFLHPNNSYFPLRNHESVYVTLQRFITDKLDKSKQKIDNLSALRSALNIPPDPIAEDKLTRRFLDEILDQLTGKVGREESSSLDEGKLRENRKIIVRDWHILLIMFIQKELFMLYILIIIQVLKNCMYHLTNGTLGKADTGDMVQSREEMMSLISRKIREMRKTER